jgi:hypothetical protein
MLLAYTWMDNIVSEDMVNELKKGAHAEHNLEI